MNPNPLFEKMIWRRKFQKKKMKNFQKKKIIFLKVRKLKTKTLNPNQTHNQQNQVLKNNKYLISHNTDQSEEYNQNMKLVFTKNIEKNPKELKQSNEFETSNFQI